MSRYPAGAQPYSCASHRYRRNYDKRAYAVKPSFSPTTLSVDVMGVGVPRVVKASRDIDHTLGSKKKGVAGGPGSSRSSCAGKRRCPSSIEDIIDTHTGVGVPRDGGRGVRREMGRRRQLMYMRRDIHIVVTSYIESHKQKTRRLSRCKRTTRRTTHVKAPFRFSVCTAELSIHIHP